MAARLRTRLARHGGMIKYRAQPGIGAVARVTGQGGGYMTCILTSGDGAVVTVFTSVRGLAVINSIGRPVIRCMAGFTQICRYRMSTTLASSYRAIVATLT